MFNLEKAIQAWKKNLAKNQSLEDTYISELEAVLRDEVADLVGRGETEEAAFCRSSEGMGISKEIGREFAKVRPARPGHEGKGGASALAVNYVRVALRKIRRQKGYSVINIAGLAVGLACCLLMTLWVREERSFDRFHENRDSIYRLVTELKTDNGALLDARTFTPLAPALKAALPEVVDFSRYQGIETYNIRLGDKDVYGDNIALVDPSFFTIFTFPFTSGDPKTSLVEPRSIVISEGLARKFFGEADPMGKTLAVTTLRDPYTVTGVIRNVPENSHLHFDAAIPAVNATRYHHVNFENWNSTFFYGYVRLSPGADPAAAGRKMAAVLEAKAPAAKASVRLQPLADIHLKSNFAFDTDNYAQGSSSTLSIFSLAAAAVLLLACINFMNLATARSANRAKEVGLRKVAGARRSDLIRQFLGESLVLSFVGLAAAAALVGLALPMFNTLAGKHLSLSHLLGAGPLATVLGITLLTGLLAGSYPALYLSAFRPVKVLKDKGLSGGGGAAILRKGLVVVQFALTVFLVIGTIVVDRQMKYVRDKNLGIDTHNVLTIFGARKDFLDALNAHPAVLSFSRSIPPGQEIRDNTSVSWEGKDPESIVPFLPLSVDEGYLELFRLGMAEGRFFDPAQPSDRSAAVVVNETAARAMGPDSPLGKRLSYQAMNTQGVVQSYDLTVIGVMKDFHQTSLHRAIEPMLFVANGEAFTFNVRIRPENIRETLNSLEKTWESLTPNIPFSGMYGFIDDKVNGFYKSEQKVRSILSVFTVLALFTACLGLSGLAAFLADRRTKEIGIRKVLGASAAGLVLVQTREFAVWVLLANVLAWPAVYYAVGIWLRKYAYHVAPGIGPAALAVAFSLAISLLAVGAKAVRAARANPVDSLKYE